MKRFRSLSVSLGFALAADLYEENNMGPTTAYRQGNYGMLLKGDPTIPESFDVAKPVFNAFGCCT